MTIGAAIYVYSLATVATSYSTFTLRTGAALAMVHPLVNVVRAANEGTAKLYAMLYCKKISPLGFNGGERHKT
jgi:hypothetical protein